MKSKSIYSPDKYVLPDGLTHALEGARILEQPLLLTGEPGTGKTSLADWASWYLRQQPGNNFGEEVLHFQTKTTSQAKDLFYTYDALAHFQAANLSKSEKGAEAFIELRALGKAIAMSNPQAEYASFFETKLPPSPQSSVVLIDEVDKAPRDFTNDILDEIDRQRFTLREQNLKLKKGDEAEIVVIMTSNSEKDLPDAFLRRCAFFHIEFPKGDRLRSILKNHLGDATAYTGDALQGFLDFFDEVRKATVRKKPATAELIGWLRMLEVHDYLSQDEQRQKEILLHNLSFLVKTQEDLASVKKLIN